MAHDPLNHVIDHDKIEIFTEIADVSIPLLKIGDFQLTLYMLLEVVVAAIILLVYLPLSRKISTGEPPRGTFWNFFEVVLTYIRDEVAKPSIGEKDADRFVPFLWTLFLFIVLCNLLGLIPFLGSPTASLSVTGVLALLAFLLIHGSAIIRLGPLHYLESFIIRIDLGHPLANLFLGIPLTAFLFVLEVISALSRGVILALRLFANMVAGHLVLAVMLSFISMAAKSADYIFWPVTLVSITMTLAVSFLELFVAFLQAFVFTLLTAIFLGMALHPEH
jgi:F-type H+-transporting ATPase subunit a